MLNLLVFLVIVRQYHKNTSIFWLLLKFESLKSVKYSSCYEFSKVETFFLAHSVNQVYSMIVNILIIFGI